MTSMKKTQLLSHLMVKDWKIPPKFKKKSTLNTSTQHCMGNKLARPTGQENKIKVIEHKEKNKAIAVCNCNKMNL